MAEDETKKDETTEAAPEGESAEETKAEESAAAVEDDANTQSQAAHLDILSRADRAGTARVVGPGGEPQLPPAPRLHVRRQGALLDLPGAGDRRRG